MERGELVPDDLVMKMVEERLSAARLRRRVSSSTAFRGRCRRPKAGRDLAAAGIRQAARRGFAVDHETLLRRLVGPLDVQRGRRDLQHLRRARRKWRAICDHDGGKLVQRADDRPKWWGSGWRRTSGRPSRSTDYYRSQGVLEVVDASASMEEVSRALAEIVKRRKGEMVICKSPAELEKMHRAGLIVWGALEKMRAMVRPGISTKELDEFAEEYTGEHHARPAFKGYRGYPGSVCTSINQEVVHGIPSPSRRVKEGDILSMDFGVELDGYFGDAALTVPVGKIAPEREKLLRVTRESLDRAIDKVRPGNRLGDVSAAVQQWVEKNGFSVVREFVGHGIGTKMHEEPQVPNYGIPGQGPRLQEGMVLAIEPMVNRGGPARAGAGRRLDRGNRRRQRFGAFRAHGRGHRERSVDFDAAARSHRARLVGARVW